MAEIARFVKAVKVGEQITGRVDITGGRSDKPICTLATSVRNARGTRASPARR